MKKQWRKNENKQTIIGKSEEENNSQALNVVHRFMSGASLTELLNSNLNTNIYKNL